MPTGTGSIQLARVFGIRIGVSASWFVVLFLFIFVLSGTFQEVLDGPDTQAYVVAVAAALLFFASLILHELGHALMARREGIDTAGIELWFFGGIAKLSRDTRSPGEEFRVAVAGPLVTLLVVAVCVAIGVALAGADTFFRTMAFEDRDPGPATVLLSWLASINIALLIFNLVPGFPLDGGRILRAAAWRITGDRARATRIAGRAGQGFAYLFVGVGVFWILTGDITSGIWLVVLSIFLGQAARAAIVQSDLDERLQGVTVADVMEADPLTIEADTSLLDAHDRLFEPNGWPWVAVTESDGRLVGVLSRERLDEQLAAGRPALPARDVVDPAELYTVSVEEPLESLLGTEGLRRIGAVLAVDAHGVLRGVVTLDRLRRALV